MEKLSNTEAELKKSVAWKKKRVFLNILTYSQEKTYVGIFWIRLQA